MSAGEAGSGAGEYGPDAGDDNMTAEALEEVKIVVVGDGAVGKTCLCHVFVKREFPHGYEPTIFENYTEIVDVANKVRLNKLILNHFGSDVRIHIQHGPLLYLRQVPYGTSGATPFAESDSERVNDNIANALPPSTPSLPLTPSHKTTPVVHDAMTARARPPY